MTYRVSPLSGLIAYRPNSVFVSGGRFQDFVIVSWIVSLGFGGYLCCGVNVVEPSFFDYWSDWCGRHYRAHLVVFSCGVEEVRSS